MLGKGYTALRELNGVMQSTEERLDIDRLHFEYMRAKCSKGQMPYEAVTLIDYEMTGR